MLWLTQHPDPKAANPSAELDPVNELLAMTSINYFCINAAEHLLTHVLKPKAVFKDTASAT